MAHWPRSVVTLTAFAGAVFAQQQAKPKSAFDKPTLEAYVRHFNLWGQQVQVKIDDPVPSPLLPNFYDVHIKATLGGRSGEITYLVSKDGQKIAQANVFDINWNPFRDELSKLKTDGAPAMGKPGATVVIALFSDFQCTYCKQQAQVLRDNLVKNYPTQVRLYFKDFPLQQIHPWAQNAAIAARCVFKQKPDAFWEVHDFLFDKQAEITPENLTPKVMAFASAKGWDAVQLSACIESKATAPDIDKSSAEAVALGVNATPTLFINGRRVPNTVDWPTLKLIVDTEIEYQKTAKNAGEDCGCDLSLPAAPGTPKLPAALPGSEKK